MLPSDYESPMEFKTYLQPEVLNPDPRYPFFRGRMIVTALELRQILQQLDRDQQSTCTLFIALWVDGCGGYQGNTSYRKYQPKEEDVEDVPPSSLPF